MHAISPEVVDAILGDDRLPWEDVQHLDDRSARSVKAWDTRGRSDDFGQTHVGRIAEIKAFHAALLTTLRGILPDFAPELSRDADIAASGRLLRDILSKEQRGLVKQSLVSALSLDPEVEYEFGTMDFKNETEVQKRVDQWAESSGDSNPDSIDMQLAVQQEFGLDDAALGHLVPGPRDPPNKVTGFGAKGSRVYVRAEYNATQAFFKAQGITHVTVFRGVQAHKSVYTDGVSDINMQPASSWTTDLSTATEFAGNGAILMTRVPVSRVLSTAVTGRGALPEAEVILLGGPTTVVAYTEWKHGPDMVRHIKNDLR